MKRVKSCAEYEKAINDLIPIASFRANALVKKLGKSVDERSGVDGKPFNHDYWTEFFHREMNIMTVEIGLRRVIGNTNGGKESYK
jgi:hypothetical protein